MEETRLAASRTGPVVVAVDGSEDGTRAVRYAVGEALRDGRRLRLVHVGRETIPMAPMMPLLSGEVLLEMGRQVLKDAERQARELGDVLEIEAVLARGARVTAILNHCSDASVVVVAPRSSTLRRWFTGSTSTGLAARSTAPVVCVPAGWNPDVAHDRILAGVDLSEASSPVVDAAFRTAEERGAALTLLHAWRPESVYDAAIVRHSLDVTWREQADVVLAELTAGPELDHPDVVLTRELDYEFPVAALVEASRTADLLLVGRHGRGAPLGIAPGSVARAMIRSASCPVEVVPIRVPIRVPSRVPGHAEPHAGVTTSPAQNQSRD